jgi:hypothetical protein
VFGTLAFAHKLKHFTSIDLRIAGHVDDVRGRGHKLRRRARVICRASNSYSDKVAQTRFARRLFEVTDDVLPKVEVRGQPGGFAAEYLIFSKVKTKRGDRLHRSEDMGLYMAIRLRIFAAHTLSNRLSEFVDQEDLKKVIKPINSIHGYKEKNGAWIGCG